MWRCGLRIAIVAVVCVTWGAPAALAQGATGAPPAATGSVDKVTLDVAAAAFVQKLPFDVPFFIVGTPPKSTTRVKALIVEDPGKKTCAAPYETAATVAAGAESFALYIERRLCADRRYKAKFQFLKKPDEKDLTRIRDVARTRFDTVLRSIDSGNIPEGAALQLHDALTEEVRRAAGPGGWESTPGGLFDISGNRRPLERLLTATQRVIAAQAQRKKILEGVSSVQDQLRQLLFDITRDPGVLALKKVPAKLVEDPAVAPVWEKNKAGLELLNLSVTDLGLLALGGSTVALEEQWSGVAEKLASYRDTLKALRQLDALLKAVTDEAALRPKFEPQIGKDALQRLADLVTVSGPLTTAVSRANRLVIDVGLVGEGLARRAEALESLLLEIDLLVVQELFVVGDTIADGKTPENPYISMDGGFIYAPRIGVGALYVGTNIYTRPVNKRAPLSEVSSFRRRFAFTMGITLNSIADQAQRVRFDFVNNQSLVAGAGYRITPSMRIGGGVLVFREANRNPNVTSRDTTGTWYLSVSVDLDVAKTLGGNGGPFSSK